MPCEKSTFNNQIEEATEETTSRQLWQDRLPWHFQSVSASKTDLDVSSWNIGSEIL